VRGASGEALLGRLFKDSQLFRLIIDEVEKTLAVVDLDIAREYSTLVTDAATRAEVFGMIEREYKLTVAEVLRLSGSDHPGARFPDFDKRLSDRLPTINRAGREQIALLRTYRATADEAEREPLRRALLLSINCVAAGFGSTG
jgi:phosphoenolpyruvate carboxylase